MVTLNIDEINTICKFIDGEDFYNLKEALQPFYSENIEFHEEYIISNESYSIPDMERQIATKTNPLFTEIDKATSQGMHNISMLINVNLIDIDEHSYNMTETYRNTLNLHKKLVYRLYNNLNMIDYMVKIRKLYLYINLPDDISKLLRYIYQVDEAFIKNYGNRGAIYFDIIHNIKTRNLRRDVIKTLNIDNVKVKNIDTNRIESLKKIYLEKCDIFYNNLDNLSYISFVNCQLLHDTISMRNVKEIYIDCYFGSSCDKYYYDISGVNKLTFKSVYYNYNKYTLFFTNTSSLKDLTVDSVYAAFDNLNNIEKLSVSLYNINADQRGYRLYDHESRRSVSDGFNLVELINKCINMKELTFIKSTSTFVTNEYIIISNKNLTSIKSHVNVRIKLTDQTSNLKHMIRYYHCMNTNTCLCRSFINCEIDDISTLAKIEYLCNVTIFIDHIVINDIKEIDTLNSMEKLKTLSKLENLKVYIHDSKNTYLNNKSIKYYNQIFYKYICFDEENINSKYRKVLESYPNLKRIESMCYNIDKFDEMDLQDIDKGFLLLNQNDKVNNLDRFLSIKAYICKLLQTYGLYIPLLNTSINDLIK